MKICLMLISMLTILLFGGCNMFPKTPSNTILPDQNTQEDIKKAREIIKDSSNSIKDSSGEIVKEAEIIKEETTQVGGKVPSEVKMIIDPHLVKVQESSTAIIKEAHKIDKATAILFSTDNILLTVSGKVDKTEDALKTVEKERDAAAMARDKAIEERDSQMHKALRWLIVGCIVLAGLFGVLFVFYGSKLGLMGAAACVVVMAMAIFVEAYFAYLAIFGGVIVIGLIGVVGYNMWVQKKALKECVDTVEVAKDNLAPETRNKLFGGNNETGIMDSIQSKTTMDLVKKAKIKISTGLWNYAKVHKSKINGNSNL